MESIYDEGESQSGTEESLKYCDEESDFDSIPDHGGWVIKWLVGKFRFIIHKNIIHIYYP